MTSKNAKPVGKTPAATNAPRPAPAPAPTPSPAGFDPFSPTPPVQEDSEGVFSGEPLESQPEAPTLTSQQSLIDEPQIDDSDFDPDADPRPEMQEKPRVPVDVARRPAISETDVERARAAQPPNTRLYRVLNPQGFYDGIQLHPHNAIVAYGGKAGKSLGKIEGESYPDEDDKNTDVEEERKRLAEERAKLDEERRLFEESKNK